MTNTRNTMTTLPIHPSLSVWILVLKLVYQVSGSCQDKLGMEDGRITDSQITASSEWPNPYSHGPTNARLNREAQAGTIGAWVAGTTNTNQWIQAKLGVTARVTGVMLQGRTGSEQRVTKFKVQYGDDGVIWKYILTANRQDEKLFDGNTDGSTIVMRTFPMPVFTKYIRIRPIEWGSKISLRFEVIGCYGGSCRNNQYVRKKDSKLQNRLINTKTARNILTCESMCNSDTSCQSFNWHQPTKTCETNSVTEEAYPDDVVSLTNWVYHHKDTSVNARCDHTKCAAGKSCIKECSINGIVNGCKECMEPIGMEDNRVADSQITASDQHGPTWAAHGARLNHDTGWSTHKEDVNQWIQVQLNQAQYLTGVITQGTAAAWVTSYKVEFTEDGTTWESVSGTIGGPAKIFDGNRDDASAVTNLFPVPILASRVRIRPTAWQRWIHIRMEWLGCLRL